MTTLMLRYHVGNDDVQTVTGAVEAAFAELERARPKGVRFTYYRVAASTELVGILELEDGVDNPLPSLEAMRRLKVLVDRVAIGAPPLAAPLERVAFYTSHAT